MAGLKTTRWLDRCLEAHERPDEQSIFPIVQGLLDVNLRLKSLKSHKKRKCNGYAIGGLSGGEEKDDFWKVVHLCTKNLDKKKPRYVMGVGHSVDMVICCALGADMFDCVYPTRTARFGCALVDEGQVNIRLHKYKYDYTPIDVNCNCSTCKRYTKAYLHTIVTHETVGCHLLSVHNLFYCMNLMKAIRESIKNGKFPDFVRNFMRKSFRNKAYPKWVVEALQAVNIKLEEQEETKT